VSAALWRRALGWLAFGAAWAIGAWIAGLAASLYIPQKIVPILPEQLRQLFTAILAAVPFVAIGLYLGLRRFLPRVFDVVRFWVLGKRSWLVIGFGMHIGIDVGMNVGTFAEVMMAVYLAWLSGSEVDAFWRYLQSRPVEPGEHGRPIRKRKALRLLLAPVDRLRYRVPGKRYTVHHHPGDDSIRRAALLRCWDLAHRLEFIANDDVPPEHLQIRIEGADSVLRDKEAGVALTKIFPGLWLLRPFAIIPGLSTAIGGLVQRILKQRPRSA
jgi:hypothetical protein